MYILWQLLRQTFIILTIKIKHLISQHVWIYILWHAKTDPKGLIVCLV